MAARAGVARSNAIAERVTPLAERAARRCDCELAWVDYVQESGNWILRVVIDSENGVNVDDCAAVSRQLSTLLDVEDFIPHSYNLEVSSPGLDRPLRRADDYRRFAGERVRIKTSESVRGRKVHRGILRGLEGDDVVLEDDSGERLNLPLGRIAEARLEVEIG